MSANAAIKQDDIDEAPADEGQGDVVSKIAALIELVVTSHGGDSSHPAVSGRAEEHQVKDIVEMLSHDSVGITVEATEEAVSAYYPAIDEAKAIVRAKLDQGGGDSEDATSEISEVYKGGKKKGKGGKGKTEAVAKPKAPKKPKATKKEAELIEVDYVTVVGTDHTFPEKRQRAAELARPDTFYLESADVRERMPHQVDPSRKESLTPVMPNLDLLEKSGNPYPATPDETVKTTDKYKHNAVISHYTFTIWSEMAKDGAKIKASDSDFLASVFEVAGGSDSSRARQVVSDTLRDLTNYGIARQYVSGRTRFFAKR